MFRTVTIIGIAVAQLAIGISPGWLVRCVSRDGTARIMVAGDLCPCCIEAAKGLLESGESKCCCHDESCEAQQKCAKSASEHLAVAPPRCCTDTPLESLGAISTVAQSQQLKSRLQLDSVSIDLGAMVPMISAVDVSLGLYAASQEASPLGHCAHLTAISAVILRC